MPELDPSPEVLAERARASEIVAIARALGNQPGRVEHAVRAIRRGDSVEEYRAAIEGIRR